MTNRSSALTPEISALITGALDTGNVLLDAAVTGIASRSCRFEAASSLTGYAGHP